MFNKKLINHYTKFDSLERAYNYFYKYLSENEKNSYTLSCINMFILSFSISFVCLGVILLILCVILP